ncbi:MAG: hypothetical protein CVU44_17955 [Chloroflexi bacterium HGW-Chloroflexi-6]|nr:MAG: hypothetical protein CVU44_17955 [Chloroflexi bacterium HGW-Chloroflexi-6]
MDALFRYLVKYEGPIYILLGLGALFALRSVWLAWDEWRKAVFGLEKEIAYQRLRSTSAVAILLLMIALSQFCLVTFVAPYLPSITFTFTATPDLLNGLSASALPDSTPEANLLALPAENTDCTPGQIMITSLEPRQEISGRVTLIGTAKVENYGFYKYEYRQQSNEEWITIAAGRDIIENGELGSWDTSSLLPGDYEIRLIVIDNQNNPLPACTIPVRIVEP